MSDTLTDRIDAHLAKARAATPGRWKRNRTEPYWFMASVGASEINSECIPVVGHERADANHIAANDPATIEAFCAMAKAVQAERDLESCPLCGAKWDKPHHAICPMTALYDALRKEA